MNKKILVVDDNKDFVEELKEILVLSDYEVTGITESSSALDVASRIMPDVVILDLKMPQKNGFQVADELKHNYELMNIPIIAMTAYFKDERVPFIETCGFTKCLKKPFNPLDLIAQIEDVLTERS